VENDYLVSKALRINRKMVGAVAGSSAIAGGAGFFSGRQHMKREMGPELMVEHKLRRQHNGMSIHYDAMTGKYTNPYRTYPNAPGSGWEGNDSMHMALGRHLAADRKKTFAGRKQNRLETKSEHDQQRKDIKRNGHLKFLQHPNYFDKA
jgi:hypothetical protein